MACSLYAKRYGSNAETVVSIKESTYLKTWLVGLHILTYPVRR